MTAHPAIEFLQYLDAKLSATFNIEHYTDLPKGAKKPVPDPLSGRHKNLTIEQVKALLPKLHDLNEKGAGIFVARNQCEGWRNESSVSRIRGVHADMDCATAEQLAYLSQKLQPSISVQSSEPGKYHLYWQLADIEELSKEEAKSLNRALVSYGADPAAVDLARLLRLPGFKHMKYRSEGQTPLVTATYYDCVYSADELRRAFNQLSFKTSNEKQLVNLVRDGVVAKDIPEQIIQNVAARVATEHPALWRGNWENAPRADGSIGYPSPSEADLALAGRIARACASAGIDIDSVPLVIGRVFGLSAMGRSDKWLSRSDYRDRTIQKALTGLSTAVYSQANCIDLESYGDIRNAKAFAASARDRYLYITTRSQWLRWEGEKWLLCEKEEQVAQAKVVCKQILDSAAVLFSQDQERGKRLMTDAMAAHNLNRIQAMLKLAVSEPQMATTDNELDGNPYLIGVENGVVDLRKGMHLFNQPEFRITRYCNASFSSRAECSRWLEFLEQVFESDIETISSVQRLLGCTILGLPDAEILVICYGHGSNGKSVFNNVVHKILGGYAVTAPPSLLTARKQGDSGPRNDIAALAGARYVSINELQAGDRLDEQIVKLLAGREKISARFLHQEFFDFQPIFTPWLRTNHKPIIVGEDDGIWRRLVLLPFRKKFDESEQDPRLEEKLLDESDGILMWMIEGARLYLQDGLKLSRLMKAELGSYRRESDLLGEFLAEHTVDTTNDKVPQGTLYIRYRLWCETVGVRPFSKKSFTQRMLERGYPDAKSGPTRFYLGISLNTRGQPSQWGEDRLDRIEGSLGISQNIDSHEEKTQNNSRSCPTRPASCELVEAHHE